PPLLPFLRSQGENLRGLGTEQPAVQPSALPSAGALPRIVRVAAIELASTLSEVAKHTITTASATPGTTQRNLWCDAPMCSPKESIGFELEADWGFRLARGVWLE